MTTSDIHIIQKSWRLLENVDRSQLGATFYNKLFTDHPGLRKMFPADMSLQYQKLIDMLHTIVIDLQEGTIMGAPIIAMGQRHVIYGVKPFHYRMVGAALLWMLQQELKHYFTKEVKLAWSACYEEVAEAMQQTTEH
ncbi:MAG: hemoglobin [Sphingobacteriales bacterium]|nr:MAG: hemoglobin [Sphingobacteriales bacterium]